MTPHLRPAHGADLTAVYQLEQLALNTDRFSRRQLYHLLHRANAQTLLSEGPSEELLGYGTLLLRRNSVQARLYSFCVHPAWRGQGIGLRLLKALIEAAMERGCERMVLEVRVDNLAAQALYRKLGFMPDAWLTDYYEDGCSAWRMACPLREGCVNQPQPTALLEALD